MKLERSLSNAGRFAGWNCDMFNRLGARSRKRRKRVASKLRRRFLKQEQSSRGE